MHWGPLVILGPEDLGKGELVRVVQHIVVDIRHALGHQLHRLLVRAEEDSVGVHVDPAHGGLVDVEG